MGGAFTPLDKPSSPLEIHVVSIPSHYALKNSLENTKKGNVNLATIKSDLQYTKV